MKPTLPMLMLCLLLPLPALPAAPECRTAPPLMLRVRLGADSARAARLQADAVAGLRLFDAQTGAELWSAGPGTDTRQHFPDMRAAFGVSFTAIHLDDDGVHDRLYAGDRAGRLWRFELRAGATPEQWAQGGVFADLGSADGARGFIAAPDVALIEDGAHAAWLQIALGTASIGALAADNRFYVLRDRLGAPLPDPPLTESDLLRLQPPLGADLAGPGYFLALGPAQVLARSLTLDGHIHFTTAETSTLLAASCPADALPAALAPLSVTVIRSSDGAVTIDLDEDGRIDHRDARRSIAHALPADTEVQLPAQGTDSSGQLQCQVGGEPLPACQLDTTVHRSYWRREDAD